MCSQNLCWDLAVPHKVKSEEKIFEDDMQNTLLFCKTAKKRIDFEELQEHHVSMNNRAIK